MSFNCFECFMYAWFLHFISTLVSVPNCPVFALFLSTLLELKSLIFLFVDCCVWNFCLFSRFQFCLVLIFPFPFLVDISRFWHKLAWRFGFVYSVSADVLKRLPCFYLCDFLVITSPVLACNLISRDNCVIAGTSLSLVLYCTVLHCLHLFAYMLLMQYCVGWKSVLTSVL